MNPTPRERRYFARICRQCGAKVARRTRLDLAEPPLCAECRRRLLFRPRPPAA
jgi:DNA-directed RNA polymerase subunit RPC12/RpoP